MKNKSQIEMLSRRRFLKNLGGAGLTGAMFKLSMLSGNLLWARSVFAADAPKRVIFYYTSNGAIPDQWMPSGSETSFTLPAMSAPLESVKQHCVFLNGVNMNNPGHGLTSKALAGDATHSLDILMAQALGQTTAFSQLQLGVISNGFGSVSRNNWSEPAFEDNPLNVFQRLFGGGGGGGAVTRDATDDLEVSRISSVLDANLEVLEQMRNELGSFEKARLDEHSAAIERIEARLTSTSSGTSGNTSGECGSPTFNSAGFSGATDNASNFDTIADLQSDIVALALQCDLTRVVTFMLGNHQADYIVPESGVDTNYHQSIHGRPAEDYILYRTYFTTKFQYLIQRLADTADMDGNSVLDNTIILHVSDMADARAHTGENAPFMLAGGGGGTLTTGRSLNLNGVDYKSLLDTVAQAAGVDIPSYGSGPISGIFN
ncbi:MAG: DUF1552 domain-containing protein [Candidatus Thiodiazotropha sp.]